MAILSQSLNFPGPKEILHEIDPELTNDDLENIIEEVDEDGSGTLDFDGNLKQSVLLIFWLFLLSLENGGQCKLRPHSHKCELSLQNFRR